MVEFRCKNCATRYSALDSRAGETTTCEQCGHTIEIPYPPLELSQEVTEGGSVVYRHEQGSQEQPLATGDQANIKLISTHVETHVGKIDNVLHERHLRHRLIDFLGSERRLNALDGLVFVSILASDFLYTRVPMTLAHHAAMAFLAFGFAPDPGPEMH